MYLILKKFLDICLFRAAPQDLPYSTFLLLLSLGGYFIVGIILSLFEWTLLKSIAIVLMDLVLLAGLSYLILWIRLSTDRYVQTLTALAGSGIILELAGLPVYALKYVVDSGAIVVAAIFWIWVFWNLAVFGHVMRYALSTTMWTGAMMSLLYFFISFSMFNTFFLSTMN